MESSDSENSSVEEIEEAGDGFTAEDDMFVDLVQTERLQPLSECLNITEAIRKYIVVNGFASHPCTIKFTWTKVYTNYPRDYWVGSVLPEQSSSRLASFIQVLLDKLNILPLYSRVHKLDENRFGIGIDHLIFLNRRSAQLCSLELSDSKYSLTFEIMLLIQKFVNKCIY